VASYHLDPWGNFRFPTELTSSKNRFAFTGHIFDEETGLYNAKARYFDPKLGRFLTQDSFLGQIDNPPSLHRYFYANANPLRYVDPTGHQSQPANQAEVDEGQAIFDDAKLALDDLAKASPHLAGPASESARQTTEHVVVDEDHGPLGNIIEGGAKWLANTWVGRKTREGVAYAFDSLDALAKKMGSASSGVVHSQAGEQDPAQRASRADAQLALEGEYAERVAQRNIGKSFQNEAADIAREGAEQATREGVPMVVAAMAGKGVKALSGLGDDLIRTAGGGGGDDFITLYHGTTSNRASKIVGSQYQKARGFRPTGGSVFFAEDMATARHYADVARTSTGASSATIMELKIPRSLAEETGLMNRSVIGADLGLPFEDIPGGTGFERVLPKDQLQIFNQALLGGTVETRRLRVR
jgi:RHS repeat-associated protein